MKKKIRWDESLVIGNELIDNQHKVMFDLANDLNNAINLGATKAVIETLFGVIIDYTFKHFAKEEELVRNDKEYMQHCYEHYQLLRQLHQYSVEFRNDRNVAEAPGDFLDRWLREHLSHWDIPVFGDGEPAPLIVDEIESIDDAIVKNPAKPEATAAVGHENMRKHRRVRYDRILNEEIVGQFYNTDVMRTGIARVVDLSSGGLKLFIEQPVDVGALLIVSCRVGMNFKMKEKVRVRNRHENYYGVEFISPDPETVRFLTQLIGAVRLTKER
ncbi:MAG: hemerythrin domain-containing protein [Desulfocapsaceae bacterium]|nr:hemerythrin domain-containing protein [Desulfocapsaceae bacterium]